MLASFRQTNMERALVTSSERTMQMAAWERLPKIANALYVWTRTQTRKVFPAKDAAAAIESRCGSFGPIKH